MIYKFPFYNENGTFLCGNYQPSSWFHLTLKFESPATVAAAAVARRERDVIPELGSERHLAKSVAVHNKLNTKYLIEFASM